MRKEWPDAKAIAGKSRRGNTRVRICVHANLSAIKTQEEGVFQPETWAD